MAHELYVHSRLRNKCETFRYIYTYRPPVILGYYCVLCLKTQIVGFIGYLDSLINYM